MEEFIINFNFDVVLESAIDEVLFGKVSSQLKGVKKALKSIERHAAATILFLDDPESNLHPYYLSKLIKYLPEGSTRKTLSAIEKFVTQFSRSNNFRLRNLAQQLSKILDRYRKDEFDTLILLASLLLEQFKTSITQQYKAAKAALLLLLKRIRPFRPIDQRMIFRRIIKFLFKNMDDRSGYANDESTRRCFAHSNHLINLQQYVQQNTAVRSPG